MDWAAVIAPVATTATAGAAAGIGTLWHDYRKAVDDRDQLNVKVSAVVLPVLQQTVELLNETEELVKARQKETSEVVSTMRRLAEAIDRALAQVLAGRPKLGLDESARATGRGTRTGADAGQQLAGDDRGSEEERQ